MVVAFPFCNKDVASAKSLLEWCKLLGPQKNHDALLVSDAAVQWSDAMDCFNLARDVFNQAEIISTDKPLNGWPQAANAMFAYAASYIASHLRQPFFWCEPDCVPLKSGWMDELEAAYKMCAKPFMGAFVRSQEPSLPSISLAGCAVYPADCYQRLQSMFPCRRAWDVDTANVVMPQAANTNLIQHFFGQVDLPPTFAQAKTPLSPINTFTLANIRSEAVVFHRSKDGSLIRLLKRKMFPQHEQQETADVVSLRRAGDIIILLPLLRMLSLKNQRPVRLVVHKDFVDLLDGVSYIDPVAWDGDWEDPITAAKHFNARNAQVFGKGLRPDTMRHNFAKLAWAQLGFKWNRYTPLVFDRRNLDREADLAAKVFQTDKPKILVKLEGHSSPFGERSFVAERLKMDFGQQAELVWLDSIRAERVYDLLGLMDRAACMVTMDTVTLWLSHASKCPSIQFVNNGSFGASPVRGNCLLRTAYSTVPSRWNEIREIIHSTLHSPINNDMVLVFSDFTPSDPDTKRRQDAAYRTWPSLGARMFSFRGQRSSAIFKDNRAMPFVRDMIEAAFSTGQEEIVVITNNDIKFDPKLKESILKSCSQWGCWWAYRTDRPGGRTDQGADVFAFTRCWWNCHRHLFPDFLLGYWWWDDVMVRLMNWSGCIEQSRLYYHEPHVGVQNRLYTSGAAHNEHLASRWLTAHDEGREKPSVHVTNP